MRGVNAWQRKNTKMAEPTIKSKITSVRFQHAVNCGPLAFNEWTPSMAEKGVTVEEKGNHIVLRWSEMNGKRPKISHIPLTNVAQVTKDDD